ncbi:MAG: YgjP-like metallopeptidase domain-containing protein [Myxococcota bacterium]|nr:YgjP-like metallopeptidase domain-containing protein [Myxococcota bacterium]
MDQLKYVAGYSEKTIESVRRLIDTNRLGDHLFEKYPTTHDIRTNKALHSYATELKRHYLRKASPVSKICYDDRIHTVNQALGLHTFVSRVQGAKLKTKNEIKVASLFKLAPEDFLRMIVVHELAHLREKDHNKAFYKLCVHMEPDYHQLEFDTRLYMIHLDLFGALYRGKPEEVSFWRASVG